MNQQTELITLKTKIMKLNEFVLVTFNKDKEYQIRPRIVCNDGFNMSVQGGSGNYCSPREHTNCFSSMEIGFPSEKEDLIMEYAEQESIPTDTVYGWVPCNIIESVIEKHGGINIELTFEPK